MVLAPSEAALALLRQSALEAGDTSASTATPRAAWWTLAARSWRGPACDRRRPSGWRRCWWTRRRASSAPPAPWRWLAGCDPCGRAGRRAGRGRLDAAPGGSPGGRPAGRGRRRPHDRLRAARAGLARPPRPGARVVVVGDAPVDPAEAGILRGWLAGRVVACLAEGPPDPGAQACGQVEGAGAAGGRARGRRGALRGG
ncbi:MAG: hypothetical protein R3F43_07855 [bacterium]